MTDPLALNDITYSTPNEQLGVFHAELCNEHTGECLRSADVYARLPSASESQGGGNPALNGCTCSQADPVNTQNGEFYLPMTDAAIPGVGPTVGITRTYSALSNTANGPFGYGWRASFGSRVVIVTSGEAGAPPLVVDILQENGSRTRFEQQADGTYVAGAWMRATLTHDAGDGSWEYIRNGSEVFRFNASGALTSTADLFGNEVEYAYDVGGVLATITGSGGRQLTLTWSGSRVTSVADSAGRTVSYVYNSAGDLTSATGVDGSTWHYTYSGHRLTSFTAPGGGVTTNIYNSSSGRVTKQIDPTGRVTQFDYNGSTTTTTYPDGTQRSERYLSGVVVEVVDAVGTEDERRTRMFYDQAQNLVRTVDAMGGETTSTYDVDGNEVSTTDALGRTTTRTFDGDGNALTVTDPLGRTTSYSYSATGQLLSTTSPAGRTQTWSYNSDGTVDSITSPAGRAVTFSYSTDGQLECQTAAGAGTCVDYNAAGQPTTQTDAAGNTAGTTFDSAGRVLTRTDTNGLTMSFEYDADGNLIETTSPLGSSETATYDEARRLLTRADAGGNVTQFAYTPTGQLASVTDPAGNATSYVYDAFDRLVGVTDAEGRVSTRTYDELDHLLTETTASGKVTTYAYDAVGNLLSKTDPLGMVTTFAYDAAGQLLTVTDPLGRITSITYSPDGETLAVVGSDNATASYAYDADGNLISYTGPDGDITSYTYDGAGRLSAKAEPGGRVTGYAYDVLGQVTTRAGPDGGQTSFSYDDGGRLIGVDRPAADADVSYAYDDDGRRVEMVDATGTTSSTYTATGQLASVTDGGGATVGYTYDSRGRLTTLSYPGGDDVTYTYDDTGLMTSVTDWQQNESTFAWTLDGQLASQALANGVLGAYGYDDAGQLLDIDYTADSTQIASYGYTYDAAGQLTGVTLDDPINSDDEREFGYDARGQIATVDGATGYTISPSGLLTATPGGRTFSYDTKLQLTASADSVASTSYTFDANGARISEVRTPTSPGAVATTSFGYTAAGALDSVTVPSGLEVAYASDGDGLRQSRTVSGSTDQFVWNVNAAVAMLLDDGGHRYVYGPTSTPIAQFDASDDVEFLLTDQLGSVRVVTDAVGAVVGSASFGVFGALEAVSGAVSAFGFTGAWTDEMTGLVYLRARDYDPATGQFLQVDPAVDDTRQPYAYAYNNPLLWTDPTGLDVWGDIGAGMLAFGAGVLDDVTMGASSAVLGALIPGYDCFTQTNPWFAAGQMTSAIVSTALLMATGVGLAVAAVKLVAKIGIKAAAKAAAATIKATVKSAVQSVKSLPAAIGGATHQAASTLRGLSQVGGKGSGGLADDLAQLANQHVTGSGDTVLGRYPGYINKAESKGASYFDIGDDWNKVTARGQDPWALNQHFLDGRIAAGDRILLSVPKGEVVPGTYLAREVQYLVSNGYRWTNQWALRPGG